MNLTRDGVRLFSIVVVASCFCCCGGLGFLGYRFIQSDVKIKDEALAYGDESVKAICKSWDPAELETRASDNLKRMATHSQFQSALATPRRKYGPLKRLINSSVRHIASFSSTGDSGAATVMTWTQCEFTNGPGRIQLNLRKQNGRWSIDAFHIAPGDL